MSEYKNITEVERETGVSKQNIRFYEKEGLIFPKRNKLNSYREYSQEDIRQIKEIKMFRMLDVSLEDIGNILKGNKTISFVMEEHQKRLEERAEKLSAAIHFCEELKKRDELGDVDERIAEIESKKFGNYFTKWIEDYKKVMAAEHELRFNFIPDGAVTNPKEFTEALIEYAQDNKVDLVMEKESMYPEFTMDGVAYQAERNYIAVRGVPVAVVHCTARNPELFEPDVKKGRRKIQKKIIYAGFLLLLAILFFSRMSVNRWEDWLLFIGTISTGILGFFRFDFFFYNENGRRKKK